MRGRRETQRDAHMRANETDALTADTHPSATAVVCRGAPKRDSGPLTNDRKSAGVTGSGGNSQQCQVLNCKADRFFLFFIQLTCSYGQSLSEEEVFRCTVTLKNLNCSIEK